MSSFLKNLEKFFVFFFAAISIVLVVMGISRVKKPSSSITPTPTPTTPQNSQQDTTGSIEFIGSPYQTPWGNAEVSIKVKGANLVAVTMVQTPNSPPSTYAEPFLVQEALTSGSADIQGVSGATITSVAFKSSLESALTKAQAQGQAVSPSNKSSVTPAKKPSVPRKYRDDDSEWFD